MKAITALRLYRRPWLPGLLFCSLLAATAPAQNVVREPERSEQLRGQMNLAKKEGAKGQLPNAWWDLDQRLDAAGENGASAAEWQALETEIRRLRNAAAFIAQMRKQKSGMEAMLGRFDQALLEIGALYGEAPNPVLSGEPAADDLIKRLTRTNLARQILVDSLTVANRRLNEAVGTKVIYQDSMITALQVEVSALRQQLWETELRAGVAEAERSAAESVLSSKQQREEAIAAVRASLGADEGEIQLTPEGTIVMRVYGISFGVGSASLQDGQQALIAKIADAIRAFPGSQVGVHGHTDDTGGHDSNLRLSRRRAETVARRLESELGLAADSIPTEGFGPDRPLAPNSTAAGRAKNRRIDVVISEGS